MGHCRGVPVQPMGDCTLQEKRVQITPREIAMGNTGIERCIRKNNTLKGTQAACATSTNSACGMEHFTSETEHFICAVQNFNSGIKFNSDMKFNLISCALAYMDN